MRLRLPDGAILIEAGYIAALAILGPVVLGNLVTSGPYRQLIEARIPILSPVARGVSSVVMQVWNP